MLRKVCSCPAAGTLACASKRLISSSKRFLLKAMPLVIWLNTSSVMLPAASVRATSVYVGSIVHSLLHNEDCRCFIREEFAGARPPARLLVVQPKIQSVAPRPAVGRPDLATTVDLTPCVARYSNPFLSGCFASRICAHPLQCLQGHPRRPSTCTCTGFKLPHWASNQVTK